VTPPGEGERRAQRGYVRQYQSAAAAIYAALERGDLEWVGLADRAAGNADDVVLGLAGRVVGHQFKTSRFSESFRLKTLLMGGDELLRGLAAAWQSLKQQHRDRSVEIWFVTNGYPSTRDSPAGDTAGHSAAFLREFELNPGRTLAEWRGTMWKPFVDELCRGSGLDEPSFEGFLQGFRLLHGPAADFIQTHRLNPEGARLAGGIARLLSQLVADARDKDRWTRAELLHELGWRDSAIAHHSHQFPVGAYVQRNVETEDALRAAIRGAASGYVSLVGPPGAGKSTLLQTSLEAEAGLILVRYLAFVPGAGQNVGRGEADDFLDDIGTQLKSSGLPGVRFRDESLHERRRQFGTLLAQAGDRFRRDEVRTVIVVDGLDHVPREEKPRDSFLAELPLPQAVPEGVLFVLGTQRLDLDDLKPAVRDQAGAAGRKVVVASLRREAVHRMADLLGLDPAISRDTVFELSRGHPLVTRYLIEALRDADAQRREALLGGAMIFDGDIETVYESAWRAISDDEEAKQVLGYLARAEGPIPLELLSKAVSEQAIERALRSTKHLLSQGAHGWSVFHNSFRLFILQKPRMRLGSVDSAYSSDVYRNLADLARIALHTSSQRWLELRYLARAQEHAAVIHLALPSRFRRQLAEGRPSRELQADIRLALAAAKEMYDPVVVFRLLLAADEIGRRSTTLEQTPSVVEALLAVGDIDAAQAFAEENDVEGYKVVDALISACELARARALFDGLEPLQQLLSGSLQAHTLHSDASRLTRWAQRVFHFRSADQIKEAIDRIASVAVRPADEAREAKAKLELAENLRLEVALAIMESEPDADAEEVRRSFGLPPEDLAALLLEAGLRAAELGPDGTVMGLLTRAFEHEGFGALPNVWRRRAAIVAARHNAVDVAHAIFDGLQVPAVALFDDIIDERAAEHAGRAVMEHAQLAAVLGRPVAEVPASKRMLLRPLQFHANSIGTLLGRAEKDAGSIAYGEIARAAVGALAYLERVRPKAGGDFYAAHQIAVASPVLGAALIRAAALRGQEEFRSVVGVFDRAFEASSGTSGERASLRRQIAVEIYRASGDSDEASRRLEQMVEPLLENTPALQVEGLADLAACFAKVGNLSRARELLARVPAETLGYALPAKKDAQYVTWRELLTRANAADPARRLERVALLMRQVDGMMRTEGSGAAFRIASLLTTEAAMFDASAGLTVARALVQTGTIGWAGLVDAVLTGTVRRRPELAQACVATWCSLALPYYLEAHYRETHLGDFIDAAMNSARQDEAGALLETFQAAIETEARAHERAAVLERLDAAAQRKNVQSAPLKAALVRWKAEAPAPRHRDTPMRYDAVSSLGELKVRLEQQGDPNDSDDYEASNAFSRLARSAGFAQAYEIFRGWTSIRRDSRARYVMVNQAIDEGQLDVARQLMQEYEGETDNQATWTAWTGGGTLRNFQARVRLDGAVAQRQAYDNFVGALAAGRESISLVLYEIEDIVPVIVQAPDWAAMWDWLAEQLSTTREHALGRPLSVESRESLGDGDMVAALFEWAAGLPLFELRRHVRVAALKLNAVPAGSAIFAKIVRMLLAGEHEKPLEALQLLHLDDRDSLAIELGDCVAALVEAPDYAVAESASLLAKRWGRREAMTPNALPPFYDFILEGSDADFEPPELADPTSGAMLIENPLGWTFPFKRLVDSLARPGVSVGHVRHRCRMLIEQWGGLEAFGQAATDRLLADLRRLDMKMAFTRPHIAVAVRALRTVAGELRRAQMINPAEISHLLNLMGFPVPPLPLLLPAIRPPFVPKAASEEISWDRDSEGKWLEAVHEDVRPLQLGEDAVIAEICSFQIRKTRRTYIQERIRAPFLDVSDCGELAGWFDLLPSAIWAGGMVHATSQEPARTICRRLSSSYMPEVPEYQLVICPRWLRRLGWRSHERNRLVYLDSSGRVVARIVWWRDGGPVDVDDDVIWGEGTYLTITPAGRAQLEAFTGPLAVLVHARRGCGEADGDAPRSRRASSRD
jgi:hypothetical protein